MTENNDRINQLLDKMETLLKRQETFSKEVNEIREEINRLKIADIKLVIEKEEIKGDKPVTAPTIEIKEEKISAHSLASHQPTTREPQKVPAVNVSKPLQIKEDLEKFIGENLINKIGIAITVIGVAIGAKYAIDHQLISPLTRIILGYLVGFGLLAFAFRLKKNYENFSAVLLSGSMAIMYFITYAAYSFYSLIPQGITFGLMVIITAFTVSAAINYNRQVTAHIGLVGAYAVPFLLSQGPENIVVLFSYTAIINIGILVISFKKYWKPLYYSSFLLTWLIYLMWFGSKYQASEHLGIASSFLSIFFATFYVMFLAYKLLQKEKFDVYDIVLLLANSFIFYGVGYNIMSKHDTGEHLLGLFTFCNAIIHSIVGVFIYRQKLSDRNLFYLVSGLVLVFITIAIPVQLNGNWITLLWAGEAALLFWIGRTKKVQFYEILSYILIYLAFFSIVRDWSPTYNFIDAAHPAEIIIPIFNVNFLTSILFTAAFGFINYLNRNPKYPSPLTSQTELQKIVSFSISGILLLGLFFSFKMEISKHWDQLYNNSLIEIKKESLENSARYWNSDLLNFKSIWSINYSLLFFSVLSFINIKKLRNRILGYINLALSTVMMIAFLTVGLYAISELRDSYLNHTLSEYYSSGIFNIGIRYISFVFVGLILATIYMYINQDFLKPAGFNFKIAFDILLFTSLIWIISSELISWMDILQPSQSYKLGLSILWGVYSLIIIGLGIWKKKKHLRIGAIALFAVTLIKLFLYDISHLDTISKTIVFVTLGILLLIISFLYNKYKNIITYDPEN
ncbi:MAG: DUF2339 domain-containing protein [Bacteroidetes bacterium]|nr:MAG: DUF2339 domain-containing protein [Bacteroidota bacterium]